MRTGPIRSAGRLAAIGTLLVAGALSVGVERAGARAIHSPPPSCEEVTVRASTNAGRYHEHERVVMTSSIRNDSTSACSIYLSPGPGLSPYFDVTNSKGVTVWDSCYSHDEPGACATVLVAHRLAAGARYSVRARWDERSGPDGSSPVQVPPGRYRFSTEYDAVGTPASVTFSIVAGR